MTEAAEHNIRVIVNQNAKIAIRALNNKYRNKGVNFEYYEDGLFIIVVFSRDTRKCRIGIDRGHFTSTDEPLDDIYTMIEDAVVESGIIRDIDDIRKFRALAKERMNKIVELEDKLTEYSNKILELENKIELQDSLIQELRHIIETNEMNTRKRG